MDELLDNIDDLISNHFRHKTKKVHWYKGEYRQSVQELTETLSDRVYDYLMEVLEEADRKIDNIMEDMEAEQAKEEDSPVNRKDFNVFMLRQKGEL